jgi:hypothetical protein
LDGAEELLAGAIKDKDFIAALQPQNIARMTRLFRAQR